MAEQRMASLENTQHGCFVTFRERLQRFHSKKLRRAGAGIACAFPQQFARFVPMPHCENRPK